MKRKLLIVMLVLLCGVLLTGCGSKESSNSGNNETTTKASSKEDSFTLKEDDKTYIVQSGKMSMVFYHDGEKLTGYALYFDFNTASEAETLYDAYKAQYEEQEDVASVSTKGKYLVVEYKPSYLENEFKDQTFSEVKAAFEYLNKIGKEDNE